MKKQKIIKRFIISSSVIILVALMTLKKEKNTFTSLALENIDALAEGEESGTVKIVCWGEGNIICPLMGEQVADYATIYRVR